MIRDYRDSDYETLCEWWVLQHFPPVPEIILPGTGYIANETAAGFMYITNSPICWIEWVVVNPLADKVLRNKSINEVIEHVCSQSKVLGATHIFSSSNRWPFIERLKRLGFEVGDTNTTQLFRKVT